MKKALALSLALNNISGGDSVGAAQMMNGYYAIDFSYGDSSECFLTGLSADRVDDIEAKMIDALSNYHVFELTDVGFIDTEKHNCIGQDTNLCWAAAD